MFIRHGEKPSDDGAPHGIDHDGEKDPHALSVRGWTRAGALTGLFTALPNSAQPQLVVPQRIVATKSTEDYRSKREVNTATPLAQRLGLAVDTDFDHDHNAQLCSSILADGRPTLVVWHHGSMADLVGAFPIANREDVPAKWPHDRFDLIWILTRQSPDYDFRFTTGSQGLLAGDTTST
jgi:hypothetical protein